MKKLVFVVTVMAVGSIAVIAQDAKPQSTASLPYAAVHNTELIAPASATFMNAEDRVIGVTGGKNPKAYPAGILAQHGLVEDDSPGGPIAVTW